MAYTQDDLTQIEAAILRLQKGEHIVSVSYEGRSVTYAGPQLSDLMALRDRMKGELAQTNKTRTRQIRLTTSKGLT